jgi:hypothetical protein
VEVEVAADHTAEHKLAEQAAPAVVVKAVTIVHKVQV